MNFNRVVEILLSIPKSLYFNLRYFDFRTAIKLPVLISRHVIFENLNGSVILVGEKKFAMVRIGFKATGITSYKTESTILDLSGNLIINQGCKFNLGTKISIAGNLSFGKNVTVNGPSVFICKKNIKIGDDVLISWDVLIMDTDFHRIYKEKVHINADCNIVINNKVWVGNRAMILKGSCIESGCIVPAAFKVTSNNCISRENSILGSKYCGNEPLNWEH